MSFLSLILLLFIATPVSAEIRLQSQPLGASAVLNFIPNGKQTSLQVIGGMAGGESENACSSKNNTSTCNNCCPDRTSCAVSGWKACNKTRIYPDLRLSFTFLSTDKIGTPRITTAGSTTTDTPVKAGTSATLNANTGVTISATWGEFCGAFPDPNTPCTFTGERTFKVGLDGDGNGNLLEAADDYETFTLRVVYHDSAATPSFDAIFDYTNMGDCTGVCNFWLYKGDEKATVKNLEVSASGFGTTFSNVVFYCVADDPSDPNNYTNITQADVCATASINGTNSLAKSTIEGMSNGTSYLYRAGIVDTAGNIGLFFHGDSFLDSVDPLIACPEGTTDCQKVTPEEVVGLFSEEMNCFIATTAYGSPMAKSVKTLRRFRDQVLKKTVLGRLVVDTYYTVSPAMARWVAQSSERRAAARVALSPIVTTVAFIMDEPVWFCVGLVSLFFLIVWRVRSRKATT